MLGPIIAISRSIFQAGQYVERKQLVSAKIHPVIIQFLVRLPLIIIALGALILGYQLNITDASFWYNAIIAPVFIFIGTILVNMSLKEELSLVGPLMVLGPIFVTITGAVYLKEMPSVIGFLGILLIVMGGYLSHFDKKDVKNTKPFIDLVKNRGAQLTVIALIFFSMGNAFTKAAINASEVWTSLIIFSITYIILSFIGIFIFIKPKLFKKNFKRSCENKKHAILGGAFQLFSTVMAQVSFSLMNIAYASALFRLSIIFQVYLGGKVFKEKNIKQRSIGAIVMIAGAVLIILG